MTPKWTQKHLYLASLTSCLSVTHHVRMYSRFWTKNSIEHIAKTHFSVSSCHSLLFDLSLRMGKLRWMEFIIHNVHLYSFVDRICCGIFFCTVFVFPENSLFVSLSVTENVPLYLLSIFLRICSQHWTQNRWPLCACAALYGCLWMFSLMCACMCICGRFAHVYVNVFSLQNILLLVLLSDHALLSGLFTVQRMLFFIRQAAQYLSSHSLLWLWPLKCLYCSHVCL